jgi:hypothetical protein
MQATSEGVMIVLEWPQTDRAQLKRAPSPSLTQESIFCGMGSLVAMQFRWFGMPGAAGF